MSRLINLLRNGSITSVIYKRLRLDGFTDNSPITITEINQKYNLALPEGVVSPLPTLTNANIDFSSSVEQTIIPAPAVGYRVVVQTLELTALDNVEIAIKDGSTTIKTFQGIVIAPATFNLSHASALKIKATTATRITGGVSYYVVAI